MDLRKKLKEVKKKGISLKLIASLTNINVNTIYNFSSGKRNLSPEKEEKIINILKTFNIIMED